MPKLSLTQHAHECELRYQEINRRLDTLETKVDNISNLIESVKTQIITLAIRGTIGIVIFMLSALVVIKH